MAGYFKRLMFSKDFGKVRLEAFSDGVFAIVMTILVLELRVPEGLEPQEIVPALAALAPKFISFIVSFLYITIYWINHHHLFGMIHQTNRVVLWLNSLFLLCLCFIPFPTALIGSYPLQAGVVIFYSLAMMATAVAFVLMKVYIIYWTKLTDPNKGRPAAIYYVAGPLLYIAASLLALFNVTAALVLNIIIPVVYLFAGTDE